MRVTNNTTARVQPEKKLYVRVFYVRSIDQWFSNANNISDEHDGAVFVSKLTMF